MVSSVSSEIMSSCLRLLFAAVLLAAESTVALAAEPSVTAGDYRRAERYINWNARDYIVNAEIQHHWIGREDRLWYLRTNVNHEKEFVVVDARTGETKAAFDHRIIADGLSKATHAPVRSGALPFRTFQFAHDMKAIEFQIDDKPFTCQLRVATCTADARDNARKDETPSSNGRWAVSRRAHNLWIRSLAGQGEFAMTTDGVEHFEYAGEPGSNLHTVSDLRHPKPRQPQVIWSPDSRYFVSYRLDERAVQDMYLVQAVPEDGSVRQKLYSYRYSLPGDEHVPQLQLHVFDVATRRQVSVEGPWLNAVFLTPLERRFVWWSSDSRRLYFIDVDRFWKTMTLKFADPDTGKVTQVVREDGKSFVMPSDGGLHTGIYGNPTVRVLTNGDVIWYSERDGWGHLYLIDGATGRVRNRITKGEWVVRDIVRVDERAHRIYFVASGREMDPDPYDQYLYSINFDGSGFRLLTPEDADHHVPTIANPMQPLGPETDVDTLGSDDERAGFSSSGRYFVDSYSRPDMPPVLALRTREGRLVKVLETADISALRKDGLVSIEPFKALAADGRTPIYGNIYRPSAFDPHRRYPVLDSIYPGPQVIRTYHDFVGATFDPVGFGNAAAVAEIGFIVLTIEGRGTPHRSKAFLDDCYGQMGKAGNLDDHIAAIRQLAARFPFMDLDRVGIYGVSGGGYASTHAILTHPEFYKVAVSAEGNHDQLGYQSSWGEIYNGPVASGDYQNAANPRFATNLRGKLFLMHGEMDDNVSPTLTMKVVDALVRSNRDFDLLIIPNGNHKIADSAYFIRREWDYLVHNLLGAEPPSGYEIHEPAWVASQRD